MSEEITILRIEKLEKAVFNLALALRRLDLLQGAGFEIEIRDVNGNLMKQEQEDE